MAILDIFSAIGGSHAGRQASAFGGKKGAIENKKKPTKKPVERAVEKEKTEGPVKHIEVSETREEKPSDAVLKEPENKKLLKKEFSHAAYRFLKSPHITEKAVSLGAQNKYVFKISPEANGVEAKKAIQELYGVRVENVNIIKIPRKKRRVGKSEGFKPGFKKIIVTLKEGDKIESGI